LTYEPDTTSSEILTTDEERAESAAAVKAGIELVDQSPVEHDPEDDIHRVALKDTGYFGHQGAGALLIAASTGRCLLMLRSQDVLQPGTYGNVGGAHKVEEEPESAARRETREETGWNGPDDQLITLPAYVYVDKAFTYRNFIIVVPEEFDPIYGWEAVGHVWTKSDDLPDPLHFGMQALFSDPASRSIIDGGWRDFMPQQAIVEPKRDGPLKAATVERIAKGMIAIVDADVDLYRQVVEDGTATILLPNGPVASFRETMTGQAEAIARTMSKFPFQASAWSSLHRFDREKGIRTGSEATREAFRQLADDSRAWRMRRGIGLGLFGTAPDAALPDPDDGE
jgi:8-oxo-dGTP pyrophosphatase MutT (NUDIX family)